MKINTWNKIFKRQFSTIFSVYLYMLCVCMFQFIYLDGTVHIDKTLIR